MSLAATIVSVGVPSFTLKRDDSAGRQRPANISTLAHGAESYLHHTNRDSTGGPSAGAALFTNPTGVHMRDDGECADCRQHFPLAELALFNEATDTLLCAKCLTYWMCRTCHEVRFKDAGVEAGEMCVVCEEGPCG